MKKTTQQNIEQPLGRILSQAAKSFLRLANENMADFDIERNFYALLLIEQTEGEITQQDLADMLHSDKVTVVRLINYLSETGYVTRGKNINDKRKYCLLLTEKARKNLPKIRLALDYATNVAFAGLEPEQIKEFLKILNMIKDNLNKKNV